MKKSLMILFMAVCSLFLVQTNSSQTPQVLQIAKKTVPNLIGLTASQAEKVCKSLKISCQKTYITGVEAKYKGKEGKVVKQSPKTGKKVTSRQNVWIYIYSPQKQTAIPIQPIKPVIVTLKDIDLKWTDRVFFAFPTPNSLPTLVATLTNNGKDATPRGSLEWQVQLFDKEKQKIYEKTDSSRLPLEGGKNYVVNFKYIPFDAYKNTDMIKLIANPNRKIPELNRNNNTFTQKNLPDLKISRIWVEDGGHYYRIPATIMNIGTKPIPGMFSITWTLNNTRKRTLIVRMPVPGYYISDSIRKKDIPEGQKTLRVKLHINDGLGHPTKKIYKELDFDNNILEVTLDLPDR